MSGTDELYPGVQYSGWWILLALGIIALCVLAVWLLVALTRPRRSIPAPPTATVPAVPPADILLVLRDDYLAQIQRIEDDYRAGRSDPRAANLALSRTVRAFVNEYSGLEAPVLSLDDLVALGVQPALIDAIRRHYYPSIFRNGPAIDPLAGAQAARTVVTSWR